jgi:cytoskeletal protein CcmA (bactofilin family)
MSGQPSFSILGADTAIKGDISASADLHVDGKVEGDIACAALVQGEASEIIGAVRVESARLAGLVRGPSRRSSSSSSRPRGFTATSVTNR